MLSAVTLLTAQVGGSGAHAALVAHWKLNEGSGDAFGDSAGVNSGFLSNGSAIGWTTDAPPVQDFAVEFSGFDSYIETPFPGIEGVGPRTVAFWVKTDVADSAPSHGIISWGAVMPGEKWHVRLDNGISSPGGVRGALRTEVDQGRIVGSTPVNDNQWHHVASVFPDGGRFVGDVLHYVDGILDPPSYVSDQEIFTRIGPDADPVLIGMRKKRDGTPQFFPGLVADMRIYDEALTDAAIQAIMKGEDLTRQLQAGDADQDFDFDQRDVVQVQIAAKYLTGRPATWGEGDWDGAPGGSPGNPPLGDGLFNQLDVVFALATPIYLTGPYAAVKDGGRRDDSQTSIVYNEMTGELAIDAPFGLQLTSINIDSASGIFTGTASQNLGGSFDNDADGNIFKATFGSSFGSLSFGNVAQPGLSLEYLVNDLTVIGSLEGGGRIGEVDLVYVPEPSTLGLFVLASISLQVMHSLKSVMKLQL